MTLQYYPIEIIYKTKTYFLLWISDEVDIVETIEDKLLWFSCISDLEKYSLEQQIGLNIIEKTTIYDFDALENWINSTKKEYDPEDLLNFWNILLDISISVKRIFSGDNNSEIRDIVYNRLCDVTIWKDTEARKLNMDNLENWSDGEILETKGILRQGINIFKDST
jgi:hypothetical protein